MKYKHHNKGTKMSKGKGSQDRKLIWDNINSLKERGHLERVIAYNIGLKERAGIWKGLLCATSHCPSAICEDIKVQKDAFLRQTSNVRGFSERLGAPHSAPAQRNTSSRQYKLTLYPN